MYIAPAVIYQTKLQYSKALRCTFFGERKNSCSSKFVQLLLLNRVKARWSKKRAAQGFHYINSFISNFFGPNSKTCTCEVRAAWGRVSRGLTVYSIGYAPLSSTSLVMLLNPQVIVDIFFLTIGWRKREIWQERNWRCANTTSIGWKSTSECRMMKTNG